jgi:hypothetical protein
LGTGLNDSQYRSVVKLIKKDQNILIMLVMRGVDSA